MWRYPRLSNDKKCVELHRRMESHFRRTKWRNWLAVVLNHFAIDFPLKNSCSNGFLIDFRWITQRGALESNNYFILFCKPRERTDTGGLLVNEWNLNTFLFVGDPNERLRRLLLLPFILSSSQYLMNEHQHREEQSMNERRTSNEWTDDQFYLKIVNRSIVVVALTHKRQVSVVQWIPRYGG